MKINKIIFFFLLILFSCNQKNPEKEIEKALLEEFKENITDYKYIVIIPNSGCTGCISNAESFLRDNIDNQNILFILTKMNSIKTLKLQIGIDNLDRKNIYIDREEKFSFEGYQNTIYPLLIGIKDNRALDIHIFDEELIEI